MPIWKFKRKLIRLPFEISYRVVNSLGDEISYKVLNALESELSSRVLNSLEREVAWNILGQLLACQISWNSLSAVERTLLWYFVREGVDGHPIAIETTKKIYFEIKTTTIQMEKVAIERNRPIGVIPVVFKRVAEPVYFEHKARG
jgi:hypothetical protein